jgi:hypothetical protein
MKLYSAGASAVTRNLPQNFRKQGSLNLTKNWIDLVVLMFLSIVILFMVGRLLLKFTNVYRLSAYGGLGFHDIYITSDARAQIRETKKYIENILNF